MALSPKKTKKPDDKAMKVALRFLMEDKPERFKVTKKQMKKCSGLSGTLTSGELSCKSSLQARVESSRST